jgi:hypothetical protein
LHFVEEFYPNFTLRDLGPYRFIDSPLLRVWAMKRRAHIQLLQSQGDPKRKNLSRREAAMLDPEPEGIYRPRVRPKPRH